MGFIKEFKHPAKLISLAQVLVIMVGLGVITWLAHQNVLKIELYLAAMASVGFLIGRLQGRYRYNLKNRMQKSGQIDEARLKRLDTIISFSGIGFGIIAGIGGFLIQSNLAALVGFTISVVLVIEKVGSFFSNITGIVVPSIYVIKWLRKRREEKPISSALPKEPETKTAIQPTISPPEETPPATPMKKTRAGTRAKPPEIEPATAKRTRKRAKPQVSSIPSEGDELKAG